MSGRADASLNRLSQNTLSIGDLLPLSMRPAIQTLRKAGFRARDAASSLSYSGMHSIALTSGPGDPRSASGNRSRTPNIAGNAQLRSGISANPSRILYNRTAESDMSVGVNETRAEITVSRLAVTATPNSGLSGRARPPYTVAVYPSRPAPSFVRRAAQSCLASASTASAQDSIFSSTQFRSLDPNCLPARSANVTSTCNPGCSRTAIGCKFVGICICRS